MLKFSSHFSLEGWFLEPFEKEFLELPNLIEFRDCSNGFQEDLKADLKKYYSPTGLSKYVWKLKKSGWTMDTDFKIKWSILTKAHTFSLGGKRCDLCLTEKTTILLHKDKRTLLNQRDEILAKCRHKAKHCLSSVK